MMIALISLLTTAFAFAAPLDDAKDSPSSISVRADGGTQNYHSLGFSGKFVIDDIFRVVTELEETKSLGTGSAADLKVGAGARLLPVLQLRAAFLGSREPNSILATGVGVGFDWTANPRDHDEHETVLSVDFENRVFRQKGGVSEASKLLSRRFIERTWRFGAYQEVTSDFSMNGFLSFSKYPSSDGSRVLTATDSRRRRLANSTSVVAGLEQFSFGLGADIRLSELWSLGLDYARSRIFASDATTDSFSVSLDYEFDTDWFIGGHGTYTRQDFSDGLVFGGITFTHNF